VVCASPQTPLITGADLPGGYGVRSPQGCAPPASPRLEAVGVRTTDGAPQRQGEQEVQSPPPQSPIAPKLRPYQLAAKSAVESELFQLLEREAVLAGERELGADSPLAPVSTLVEMPTGSGKTVLFAAIAADVIAGIFAAVRSGRRVLVVAHRTELLTQALNKLVALGLDAAIEQADKRAGQAQVVVASVQTLRGKRLLELIAEEFGLVVDRRGPPLVSQRRYRDILAHLTGVPTLIVTATPDRGDGKGLGVEHGACCRDCCYRYELRQAITDGWLVKITARVVELKGVSLADIRTRHGDLDQQQLAEVMADEQAVLGVVIPLLEQAVDRPTVLFAVTVAHAFALAEALCDRRPGCARAAHGELSADDRAEVLARS
jgi:superfamily II DNA or RNA helicase